MKTMFLESIPMLKIKSQYRWVFKMSHGVISKASRLSLVLAFVVFINECGGLRSKAENIPSKQETEKVLLRSKQHKEKVLALIAGIKETYDGKYNEDSNTLDALTEVYNEIILYIEPMTPQDKADLPLDPILKPLYPPPGNRQVLPKFIQRYYSATPGSGLKMKRGPTVKAMETALALLVKIGPTSIPILEEWLIDSSEPSGPSGNDWDAGPPAITKALEQIGTPEALEVITAWNDERAHKEKQKAASIRKKHKEEEDAARLRDEYTKAANMRERREILALEPQGDFKQVLGVFYDSSLSVHGISASHYKRKPYKNGVRYSIYVSPGAFLNMSVYILPTERAGVFYVRILPEQIIDSARVQKISEDRMVDATPGMPEYFGSTSVVDLATRVMQSWVR